MDGPHFAYERFLNHGWDDEGKLKVLVKWFGFPQRRATWKEASSLPRESIMMFCMRNHDKIPPLMRKGVFFSDQVERRAFGTLVAQRHRKIMENKKSGSAF